MNRKGLFLTALLCVLTLALFSLHSSAGGGKVYKIGDKVADFTFKDGQGKSVSLAQFKGKVVVLNFFATW